MALRIEDKWIWDFWLAKNADTYHMFYLQAPKSIGDPDLRHWNASIGHAHSKDLTTWEVLPDALRPGAPGSWDDFTTWTGSVIEHDGTWYLFYTGSCRVEEGAIQRIGLATSNDLMTFERHGAQALLEADPRWYETFDAGVWHDQAWRDPWVFRGDDGWFHMTITARESTGPVRGRGVVARASSSNLLDWEVHPPITTPDGFGQTEVSQIVAFENNWYLLFCSDTTTQSETRQRTGPGTGTYYIRSDEMWGPFDLHNAKPLSVDSSGTTYAGKLVWHSGRHHLLSWHMHGPDGGFIGEISDPIPVAIDELGELEVVGTV